MESPPRDRIFPLVQLLPPGSDGPGDRVEPRVQGTIRVHFARVCGNLGGSDPMKHLKSSVSDLRRLFDRTITLRDIAEPLVSFDETEPVERVVAFMRERGFDVVGVRSGGWVRSCFRLDHVHGSWLAESAQPFAAGEVLPDSEPLLGAFEALRERRQVFIKVLGHVGGIVTRGDLQKAPVRLWIFGLISLLEMQMLRVVRERYPDGSWEKHLTPERLEAARRVFEERRRRKEENDLTDCLQLSDKATVLMKDPVLFAQSGFPSKRALEGFFREAGLLRNALAHANDILLMPWPELAELVAAMEALLERLELSSPGGS